MKVSQFRVKGVKSYIYYCKHCVHRQRNRPLGLCNKCFGNPNIRYQYQKIMPILPPRPHGRPNKDNHGRRGICLDNVEPPTPPEPTDVPPGPDRVAIYVERLESGFGLWHPQDGRITPDYHEEEESE